MWLSLFNEEVPKKWLHYSYATSRTALPNYIKDLTQRLDFINRIEEYFIKGESIFQEPLWFGSFFD